MICPNCGRERDKDVLRAQLATVTAERDKARADWESANGFANSFARSTFDAERERDVLRARLAEVERERESLQLQLEKVLDGKEGAWMARALDAECERDALKEKYSRPAYAESHRLDSMWQELVRERAEAVFELRRIRERIAALESTAEDARTCAEYVLSDEFADDYESIAEAASRVLGQLPPRPVLDLDDVRMVCEWIAEWPDAESHQLAARRVLAALAKMGGE